MKSKRQNMIIILGMHLSGTTMLAQMVCATGQAVKKPRMKADEQHPSGHYENVIIHNINRFLLYRAGGSWDNPPNHKDLIKYKVPKIFSKGHNVVKDPKLCLTLALWDFNGKIIVIKRSDNSVAKSLSKRNNIPYQKGLELCNIYRERLNIVLKNKEYHSVLYEDLLCGYDINRLANYLEINKIDEMKSVINVKMKHY